MALTGRSPTPRLRARVTQSPTALSCMAVSLSQPHADLLLSMEAAAVGTPVTRRPPRRPGRAVFPHPVPRLHSPPRRPWPCPVTPCLLWPAGRLAHPAPVRHVRAACPCRAPCFRRDLPPVVGFPHLRVLCAIRLPIRLRRACPLPGLLRLPVPLATSPLRCQHGAVSGCPLPCLQSGLPSSEASTPRSLWGLPRAATPLFRPATACGLRRTCPALPPRMVLSCLRDAFTPSASARAMSTLYQHCRGRGSPYGL